MTQAGVNMLYADKTWDYLRAVPVPEQEPLSQSLSTPLSPRRHETRVIALEGLPGLGKTTLIHKLADLGYITTPEIPDTEKKRHVEIPPEVAGCAEPRYVNEWYLQKELNRAGTWDQVDQWQFVDRCVYTQIAHVYANDQLVGTHELAYLFHQLLELEREGKLLLPGIIYFRSTIDFSRQRIYNRNREDERRRLEQNGPPYSVDFLTHYREAFDNIASALGTESLVVNIPEVQDRLVECFSTWTSGRQNLTIPSVLALIEAFGMSETSIQEVLSAEPECYAAAVQLARKDTKEDQWDS